MAETTCPKDKIESELIKEKISGEINCKIETKIEIKIKIKVVSFFFSSVSINLSCLVYRICTIADFQITLQRVIKWHIHLWASLFT